MSLTETTMSQPGCTLHHGVHCGPGKVTGHPPTHISLLSEPH